MGVLNQKYCWKRLIFNLKTPVDDRLKAQEDAERCMKQTSKGRYIYTRNASRRRKNQKMAQQANQMLLTKVKAKKTKQMWTMKVYANGHVALGHYYHQLAVLNVFRLGHEV